MKRRITIYIVVGSALAAGLFYWLYIRPLQAPGVTVLSPDDALVKKSLAEVRDKVLVIGVDGMTWSVALDLMNQGRMPHLARLVQNGAHGVMRATPPLISPALWTTMATGQPREVHGIDNFFAKLPFEYREVVMTSRFRQVPALWQMADWAGKSVGVVNWYAAQPAEPLKKGVFIAEGLTRPEAAREEDVSPPAWRDKVRTTPLPKLSAYEDLLARVSDGRVQRAYDQDRMVFALAHELLRAEQPDLMMVYFQGVDLVSHGFWKYRFPLGLDHDFAVSEEERERYGAVVEMHYEFTDHMIAGLLSLAEGYHVMVVSDHGFGPTYQPDNIFPDLNKLLERLGYLTYEGQTCDNILQYLVAMGWLEVPYFQSESIFTICQQLEAESNRVIAAGEDRMPAPQVDAFLSVHYIVKPPQKPEEEEKWEDIMEDLSLTLRPQRQRQEVFWSKTLVFNGKDFHQRVQGLYLNLAEREPEGVVSRENYSKFRGEVIKQLRALRTDAGRRFFTSVRANPAKPVMPTTFHDPPDILVEVNREALTDNVVFRRSGDEDPIPLGAIRWSYYDVSGDHQPEGVFVLSGPKAKSFKRVEVTDLDIAPTLLWLLGLPVGEDMPGKVRRELADDHLAKRPILYIRSWNELIKRQAPSPAVGLTPEQIERMKAVGYIQDHPPPLDTASPAGDTAGGGRE
jgi:predicted AlkP superfamily phosphohydrolase/phosphomutase